MKKRRFMLVLAVLADLAVVLGCFWLIYGPLQSVCHGEEPVKVVKKSLDPNFGGEPINLISTQKQLDALKLTEKERKAAISELVDNQKNAAEVLFGEAKIAEALLEKLPKSNLTPKVTIVKAGALKGKEIIKPVVGKDKTLLDRNSPERRALDYEILMVTRDSQYSMKGDFKATRIAVMAKQQQLIEAAKRQASGKTFVLPGKLLFTSFPGQLVTMKGSFEHREIFREKLEPVQTIIIVHHTPEGMYMAGRTKLDREYYHLVGWPEGALKVRNPSNWWDPPWKLVDVEAVVQVGDTANINGVQGIVLAYVSSIPEIRSEVSNIIADQIAGVETQKKEPNREK